MSRFAQLVAGMWALLPLAVCAADTAPLRLEACDEVVRAGVPFRCRVVRDQVPAGRGPWVVHVALEQAGRELASQDLTLDASVQIRTGVGVVLIPAAVTADEATLRVVFADATRAVVEQHERRLSTPGMMAQAADQAIRAALTAQDAPLPRLWSEQLAELAHLEDSARNLAAMSALITRCRTWAADHALPGTTVATVLSRDDDRALVDPVDGSVQPWRLVWSGVGQPRAVAIVLGDHPTEVVKARWCSVPAPWLSAANAAGVAVAEVYPAGDRRWRGIGPHRAALVAEAARAALGHATCPLLMVGVGEGATGVVAVSERTPGTWRGALLVRPRVRVAERDRGREAYDVGQRPQRSAALPWWCVGDSPESLTGWWLRVAAAGGRVQDHVADPSEIACWRTVVTSLDTSVNAAADDAVADTASRGLAAYAGGPFVVVVGTAEHAAAVQANERLAEAFVTAWSRHAHGRPPVLRDRDFRAAEWPRHHLVCIGNPRSNRVLADLFAPNDLPLRWDDRQVFGPDVSRLRSLRTPIALGVRHPGGGGRHVVILDGAPVWRADDGLPLAGLPDLVMGDVDRPIIWATLGSGGR